MSTTTSTPAYTVTFHDGDTLDVPGDYIQPMEGHLAVMEDGGVIVGLFPQSVVRSVVRKTDPAVTVVLDPALARCQDGHPTVRGVRCDGQSGHEGKHQNKASGVLWSQSPTPEDARRMGLVAPPRPEGHNPVG